MWKKIISAVVFLFILAASGAYFIYYTVDKSLPEIIKIEDYQPLLVSQVYDRNDKKIGEFFRERRVLIPYKDIPKIAVEAFLAAEDDQFFQHKGINPQALFRAAIANMRAGHSVQGGSTITQQVAKTLLLSNEKTYARKLRDILLALRMEKSLTKEEILYLYLNQIYFGQSAYGIEMAAQTYFKKSARQLTLPEAAILAGLPKAPSDYSPVKNPYRAKERQVYVLTRMAEVGFITKEESEAAIKEPVKVYLREDYEETAPYFLETVRQLLVQQIGEEAILDKGVKIYTSLDLKDQLAATESVQNGLKELDKRQGFRGPVLELKTEDEVTEYLNKQKKKILADSNPERTILPDGSFAEIEWQIGKKNQKGLLARFAKENKNTQTTNEKLPSFLSLGKTYPAVVEEVNDAAGFVQVKLPEAVGMIDFETMTWARKPNAEKKSEYDLIKKPSQALKKGDVVLVKIIKEKFDWSKNKNSKLVAHIDTKNFLQVELDQEPLAEGALLSIDQDTQDVLAMVGGYSYERNKYNHTIQAERQTGSAFKAMVYAAALEKNYNPSSLIIDAPIVYKEAGDGDEGQGDEKLWKPSNHGRDFSGEITMRNALVRSLNIPSVKIVEDVGVSFATEFARRLGVFSKLNPDFTLVLGSSSLTLYEMTKVFSEFGRLGVRTRPRIVKRVIDQAGKSLLENLTLESRFLDETKKMDEDFEQKRTAYLEKKANTVNKESSDSTSENSKVDRGSPFYFDNPEQLVRPQTAAVITNMLRGVVEDPHGTGGQAAQLGRPTAAKTGTTNGYVDAWFVGYTPNIATGVWVGFDRERSLGRGEVGGKAALPIWLSYMKAAHESLPVTPFQLPEGVKLVKIDADSGKLANSGSKRVIEQAFVDGTEPTTAESRSEETTDHLKQDIDE